MRTWQSCVCVWCSGEGRVKSTFFKAKSTDKVHVGRWVCTSCVRHRNDKMKVQSRRPRLEELRKAAVKTGFKIGSQT